MYDDIFDIEMMDTEDQKLRNLVYQYAYHTGEHFDPENHSVDDVVKLEEWARSYTERCREEHRQRSHRQWLRGLVRRDRSMMASMANVVGCDNNLIQMLIDTDYEPHDDNIYRVAIEGCKAEVVCLGLDSIDAKCTGEYYVSKLPKWIQQRLAVLLMLDPKSPSGVEGVGVRLERNIFWVFKDGNKSLIPDTSSHGD